MYLFKKNRFNAIYHLLLVDVVMVAVVVVAATTATAEGILIT